MKVLFYISSLFIEKKCFWCQKSGHFFCEVCRKWIQIYKSYCYICKKPSENFSVHNSCNHYFSLSQIIVLTRYRHAWIKKLLRHAKFYNKHQAYTDAISPNTDFFKKYVDTENSIFIPVPMHFLRKWKRGYNQSEKIAGILSQILDTPVNTKFIKRIKNTKQQSHLSQSERAKNLSGVFSLKNTQFVDKNSTIYLIDDVISTGSTLSEIAKLLRKNGYKDVRAIVLASD